MKAIVREKYGSWQTLHSAEVDIPLPKAGEVQVKVHAVSLNASDVENMSGSPLYIRAWGLFKPNYNILGSDIAGTVSAVGEGAGRFKTGDAVYGDALYSWGGFAEYACIPEKMLKLKPALLSFEEAASLPQAGAVAEQGIRFKRRLQLGDKVLINGAGGGGGSFAVQLAKLAGAEVSGVDSAEKLAFIRSLGADHTIDYREYDFTKNRHSYDFILDLVASHPISHYRRALTPRGIYCMVGGKMRHLFQTLVVGSLLSLLGSKKLGVIGVKPNEKLEYLEELISDGKLKPAIDRVYPLEQVPEAMQYLSEGKAKGKVVIKVR
ncbi:NAD(P)-dependent alcohol dehydrogenase [Maribellus sp. CM-23]|uniref:NAD(P)-dependent alcohol dehydrogenase n=1 Tax=Maribellus sp. CM-23 TaxID=2781026 RepID=UPI001F44662A|nr:NAD(P)-dependent alcohol dehydrogenase [Maribellus sp. CM-23]MCE4566461.1 NAD(P)-dependent alcohol dehydrogenase [Maribellus sp. CM-23]